MSTNTAAALNSDSEPALEFGRAICYSGYREGQSPREGVFPSYEEILEDLKILEGDWDFLRIYDCSQHAQTLLKVIENEKLPFQVMLGVDLRAEESNPGCPWGAQYSPEQLLENAKENQAEIELMISLANRYPEIVFSASIGNEASVEWTDHLVSVESLVSYARRLKECIKQPITFCENYVPWNGKLAPLVAELDFISLHTYPVWEYKTIVGALAYTKENYYSVANHYPDKPVIITEAGWTTRSNGRGIEAWNASQELQAQYYEQLLAWSDKERILTFVFEAFDEPWKGSEHPDEPEKHWGLYTVDRKPKLVLKDK